MKRILYILFAALTLSLQVSCQKEDASADISGEWHLDNSGLAYDADVYVVFSGGSFRLYQKVGDHSRPWLYEWRLPVVLMLSQLSPTVTGLSL